MLLLSVEEVKKTNPNYPVKVLNKRKKDVRCIAITLEIVREK